MKFVTSQQCPIARVRFFTSLQCLGLCRTLRMIFLFSITKTQRPLWETLLRSGRCCEVIVNRLENCTNHKVLQELRSNLTPREINKGQKHKIFKDSFDAKPIYGDKFLFQKLDYIHGNPVKGKWTLARDNVGYEHSSASFYELNEVKHFSPKHYKDL